jgi:hypothetical protein
LQPESLSSVFFFASMNPTALLLALAAVLALLLQGASASEYSNFHLRAQLRTRSALYPRARAR